MIIDSYYTLLNPSRSEIKVSKSNFISQAFPFTSVTEIPELLRDVRKKHFDASHHPFAYRAGVDKNVFKTSDDGEPSGSSGRPILEAIDKHKITDTIVIVTRYFGGTKLGVGGLRRAYFESADECLKNAVIVEKLITEFLSIEFEYTFMNSVMKIIETEKIRLVKNNSDEKCKLKLEVRISGIEKFKTLITQVTNGKVKIT